MQQVRLPDVGAGAARGHKVAISNPMPAGTGQHTGTVLQQFDVHLDGEVIGQVRSVERTENVKAAGARYVTRTKHSIGWQYARPGVRHRTYTELSRIAAVLDLVNTVLEERTADR